MALGMETGTGDQILIVAPSGMSNLINNPREITQSKGRAHARIIDQLTPTMTTANGAADAADGQILSVGDAGSKQMAFDSAADLGSDTGN
eukprot:CAMPEP_0194372206 /NCGR_PEP_ID=MMETSP0174-20130528/20527_1 /TAXON_ID=216777 /ORGANISM="Proboscia alata, Strain PI-D3" /LENGTH=89 /DNA_ID=CAMNT_0039150583 /DNA_START=26 /DNA_END=296 /DNA_ORIENTATION=+